MTEKSDTQRMHLRLEKKIFFGRRGERRNRSVDICTRVAAKTYVSKINGTQIAVTEWGYGLAYSDSGRRRSTHS